MKKIYAKQLEEKLKAGEQLNILDVREDEEVATGKIPGAKHIPLGQIPERLNELVKDKPYYIVCRSGGRSGQACAFLSAKCYDVTNVEGGMLAWEGETE